MKTKITPAELMMDLALHATVLDTWRSYPNGKVPGAFINALPEETRAILRELKSGDIENLRPDALAL